MHSYIPLCVVVCLVGLGNAIPIDNGIEGEPEISCGPTSIAINFNTRNNWEGKLYVKNLFENGAPCVVQGTGNGKLGSIELEFDQCGVSRARSLEPRGVYVWVTVIMSFHPTFVTKVDRAVRAQCFYMEADKTVSQDLEVSMLTTAPATFNVPMPTCHYEIRESRDENSDEVKFAIVGQSVWHHWHCETDYEDTFCSVPYDCFVDDGTGNAVVNLLDEEGCSLDANLLDNPEYPGDLWAVKESHVFKYADKPNLYFNCQMRVTIKEPNQDCPRPSCSAAPRFGAGRFRNRRGRRGRFSRAVNEQLVADVSISQPIFVADVDFDGELNSNGRSVSAVAPQAPGRFATIYRPISNADDVCMTSSHVGLIGSLCVVFFTATVIMAVLLYVKPKKV